MPPEALKVWVAVYTLSHGKTTNAVPFSEMVKLVTIHEDAVKFLATQLVKKGFLKNGNLNSYWITQSGVDVLAKALSEGAAGGP